MRLFFFKIALKNAIRKNRSKYMGISKKQQLASPSNSMWKYVNETTSATKGKRFR